MTRNGTVFRCANICAICLLILHLSTTQVFKRRDISALMVQRAERNGFKAIVLTVDTPKLGRREADIKNKSYFISHLLSCRRRCSSAIIYCNQSLLYMQNMIVVEYRVLVQISISTTCIYSCTYIYQIITLKYLCRMIAPQLKNFEGLLSTDIHSTVSS